METIQLVIAFATQKGWPIHQLDVKSAFLHGELIEDVFIEQPCGYIQKGKEEKVYKLTLIVIILVIWMIGKVHQDMFFFLKFRSCIMVF